MTLILCLSENNGMAFNHRRQSRDEAVCRDIAGRLKDEPLYLTEYSAKLFSGTGLKLIVSSEPIVSAPESAAVFIELCEPEGMEDVADRLIIYRWNRDYPADSYFRMDMSPFEMLSEEKLIGNSHPEISIELWERA